MAINFTALLKSWENHPVTIINPQSYTVSKITDGISFESYSVNLDEVTEDYIKVTFVHRKKNEEQRPDLIGGSHSQQQHGGIRLTLGQKLLILIRHQGPVPRRGSHEFVVITNRSSGNGHRTVALR